MICKIPLTKGQFALVDERDFIRLSQWSWYALARPEGKGFYACRTGRKRLGEKHTIYMHAEIVGLPEADHKNGDGLDNRNENLRKSSRSQNQMNRGKDCDNSSGFKGVKEEKRRGGWYARLSGRYLGYFRDKVDAAKAYDAAAKLAFGEFAKLNFP
jgi:hypothetical protein